MQGRVDPKRDDIANLELVDILLAAGADLTVPPSKYYGRTERYKLLLEEAMLN